MGTARPDRLETVKQCLGEWLKPAKRRVLEEDLANGDTVTTGLAIMLGNVSCALAREEKSPIDQHFLESLIVQLGDAKNSRRLFDAYNLLGQLAYQAINKTNEKAVPIGLHTYFVRRDRGVRKGLFVCDRGPIDVPHSRRVHGHDRRGVLTEYADFLAQRLPPVSLEDVVNEECLAAAEALGDYAQKIGQDLLGIMDPVMEVPKIPESIDPIIDAFFDEVRDMEHHRTL